MDQPSSESIEEKQKVDENNDANNKNHSESSEESKKQVETDSEDKTQEDTKSEEKDSEENKENSSKKDEAISEDTKPVKEEYVKGPGKAKQKTIKMDEDDLRMATPRAVELEDKDQSDGRKIDEIRRGKGELAKTRSRRNIVQDGDDAYSYRHRGILQDAKWRPDHYAEKVKEIQKKKGMTVYEKMQMARKENPILRKKIDDDMESARGSAEDMEEYLKNLRRQRKAQYYDDEDLYGSDDSDTETRMKKVRQRPNPLPPEKVNQTMEDRRARLLRMMMEETERIDEVDRKKEAERREASRRYEQW